MLGVKDKNVKRWQDREARWMAMLAEAEAMPVLEVFRRAMAAVSANVEHRCRECMDCACVTHYLATIGGARTSRVIH